MTKTTTAHQRTALIIGGGIAGTVAAVALQRAGLGPTVFESHGAAADGVGAFLTVAVNGLAALEAVGIDRAQLGGFDTPRMEIRLGDGHLLAELAGAPPLPSGAVTRTLKRADLYGALRAEAERRGIPVVYGKRLVDARRTPDGTVVARFGDGTAVEGDLLVGADGIHSRVRALIDPDAPGAEYIGLLNTGGYARGVAVPGAVGTMQMIFGKRCFFGYVPHPNGEVWWFANPARATAPSQAELAAVTSEQWRAELLDLFAGDAAPAADLIRATEEIFAGWATYDMPNVPRWHDGRMIIIGDAAHAASPSSGQGASMAIEDAVELARCLRDEPAIERAFAAYEGLRRERVERIVAQGRRNGDGKTPGRFGRVVRDLALRVVFRRLRRKTGGADPLAWIHEHRVAM